MAQIGTKNGRRRWSGWSVGSFVAIGFGTAWLVSANAVVEGPSFVYVACAVCAIVMSAEAIRLDRLQAGSNDEYAHISSRWTTRVRNQFILVNAFQLAGIVSAVVVGNAIGQPERITGAALTVVGLHFIPLARLFRAPLYYFTGAVMTACGIVSALIDTDRGVAFGAFAAGLTLWTTAAIGLVGWRRRLASTAARKLQAS